MDDTTLSLGYTTPDEETYANTRRYILSTHHNPWFYKGSAGEGEPTGPRVELRDAMADIDNADIWRD